MSVQTILYQESKISDCPRLVRPNLPGLYFESSQCTRLDPGIKVLVCAINRLLWTINRHKFNEVSNTPAGPLKSAFKSMVSMSDAIKVYGINSSRKMAWSRWDAALHFPAIEAFRIDKFQTCNHIFESDESFADFWIPQL